MKSETFLVQADNHNSQLIACATIDQLVQNFPVSVVFFYRKSIHINVLIDALRKVLSDFPIFAGTLKNIDGNLYIDCNNKGLLFSVTKDNCALDHLFEKLSIIEKRRLVDIINPKKVISAQSPIMTIKINNFTCGGMSIGVCWHHSIGDMHSFMCFMKAWSNTVNKKEYVLPLIIKERDKYLEDNLEKDENGTPGARYLKTIELLKFFFYLLLPARNKLSFGFYFSENELKNMREEFSVKTGQKLSRNDVLCAHIFSIIAELDAYTKKRYLSIVVNYRARTKLPQNILGNFVSFISILTNQQVDPVQLAQDLRASVDNFQRLHMNIFSTKKYIEQNGGVKKIARFVPTSIDPLKRTLLVTNWANFGVYELNFGDAELFYFTPFGDPPLPWLSVIVEGFANNGLIYYAALPSKLAKKLMQKNNLRKIHKYREQTEILSQQIGKIGLL